MSLINRDITWNFGNYGIGFDYQHAGDITPLELIERCQKNHLLFMMMNHLNL